MNACRPVMGAATSRHYAPLALDSSATPPPPSAAAAAASPSPSPHCATPPTSSPPPDTPDNHNDNDDDDLVPTVFHWTFGGTAVFVAGAWDNWKLKTPMSKTGHHHMALVYIPCGQFQFKYFVDNTWQCAPNLPTTTDAHGNNNNLITVRPVHPQFDLSAPLSERPPSSPSDSYDQSTLNPSLSTDPPLLPPFLEHRCLKPLPDDISPRVAPLPKPHPQHPPAPRPFFSHVSVDHLYVAPHSDPSLRFLSHTSRHYGKIVNTVFLTSTSQPQQPQQPQQQQQQQQQQQPQHEARKHEPRPFATAHPS